MFLRLVTILLISVLSLNLSAQDLAYNHKNLPCLNKHFNVYVHITIDTFGNTNMPLSSVIDAFDQANEPFAPICVSFGICKIDTILHPKFNLLHDELEVEEIKNLFSHDNRVNLYLIGDYFDFTSCGFTNQSQINNETDSDIFVVKPCGGITLIHQFGHMFGLLHTYGTRTELVDGSNCDTTEDMICDTPADPFIAGDSMSLYVNNECEFIYIKEKDENDDWYQPDIGNYMASYPCKCGFTRDQYLRMVETYHLTDLKNW